MSPARVALVAALYARLQPLAVLTQRDEALRKRLEMAQNAEQARDGVPGMIVAEGVVTQKTHPALP